MVTKKNISLSPFAQSVIATMKQAHYECYLVGGSVRDLFLKRNQINEPLDFATNATPEQIIEVFPNSKYENNYGTVMVLFPEQEYIEITTYRCESTYSDARHPDKVYWGKTIEQDVERRDFTINALAFDGISLVDKFGGQNDIKEKIIKTVGKPNDRFTEDALRMMRAIRFACQLQFVIDQDTLLSIQKNSGLLFKISMERVRDEFLKILGSDSPHHGILLLKNTDLLKLFLPELYNAFGVGQISPNRHHIYDVGTHLIKTLEACKNPDPIVRLACLLHDIGKPKTRKVLDSGVVTFYNHEIVGTEMAFEIAKRIKLSKKDTVKLTKLVRYHQFVVTENLTDNAVKRFIRQIGKEYLYEMLDVRFADRIGSGAKADSWRFDLFRKRLEKVQEVVFEVKDLAIDGNDVMHYFNQKPGPFIGDVLDKVFFEVTEKGMKNDKETLLNYLKEIKEC